jgi:hypothetical protein
MVRPVLGVYWPASAESAEPLNVPGRTDTGLVRTQERARSWTASW